jgi:hypothetical protein
LTAEPPRRGDTPLGHVQPGYFLFCRTSNQTARLMMRPLMISW